MKRLLFLLSLAILVGCTCLAQNVPDQLLPLGPNCVAVVPDYTDDVDVVDNCPLGTVVTQAPLAGASIVLSQPCTITATDAAGNASTLVFNLVLDDVDPPVITPIGDLLSLLRGTEIDQKEEVLPPLLTSK